MPAPRPHGADPSIPAVGLHADALTGADSRSVVLAAYEEHRAAIYGFLLASTRDGELAAELLQETFARLLKAMRAGDAPLELRAWLFRVAGNLAVSAARRRQMVRRFAPWLVRRDTTASPEQDYLRQEEADQVHRQLAQLRPDDRVALLMAAHGCTTGEIAAALKRTELATRSLLCRARMRLRDRIEAQEVAG